VPDEKKTAKRKPSLKKLEGGAVSAVPAKPPSPGSASGKSRRMPSAGAVSVGAASAKPRRAPSARAAVKAASAKKPVAAGRPAARRSLKSVVLEALDDMKALEVKMLDVRGLTDIADFMVIASGTSDRHVRSVAQRVVEKAKEGGYRPHGVEGLKDGDWVLIDLHEMIVHVMLPRVREFYGLEKLWDMTATRAARA
jgi:ribosome silencing factor RsfS/YbeB/iojap